MKRAALLVLALSLLTSCAPKIVSQTPAGVEISCTYRCSSEQDVADLAQNHCQKYGLNAQQDNIESRKWASYRCVR